MQFPISDLKKLTEILSVVFCSQFSKSSIFKYEEFKNSFKYSVLLFLKETHTCLQILHTS